MQDLGDLLLLLSTAVDSNSTVKGPVYFLCSYLQFAKGMSDLKDKALASRYIQVLYIRSFTSCSAIHFLLLIKIV